MGETENATTKESSPEGKTLDGKLQNAMQALSMRERAIAQSEEVLAAKVETVVWEKMKALGANLHEFKRAQKVFNKIAGEYPATIGKAVSKKEREDDGTQGTNLVYGEIQFATFALTLEKIKTKYGGMSRPGGTFVDIGSGTGKAVFAALLLHEFDKVLGIEILHGLFDVSQELNSIWNEIKITADVSPKTRQTKVELLREDALVVHWGDADIAFVNSTCFDKEMMELLAVKAEEMKPGSFFISFTRRLPSTNWQVLEYERQIMSWGEATVFIHQKKGGEEAS